MSGVVIGVVVGIVGCSEKLFCGVVIRVVGCSEKLLWALSPR